MALSQGGGTAQPRLLVTDEVIGLRPLRVQDTDAQMAGEDAEIVRWLSGGWATEQRQREFLLGAGRAWHEGAPVVDLGIEELASEELVGMVGIQSGMSYLRDGQVNITYGLYPQARNRGLATRAVLLAMRLGRRRSPVREFVIRVHPDNAASARVARRAGYVFVTHTDDDEGSLDWYVLPGSSDHPQGRPDRSGA